MNAHARARQRGAHEGDHQRDQHAGRQRVTDATTGARSERRGLPGPCGPRCGRRRIVLRGREAAVIGMARQRRHDHERRRSRDGETDAGEPGRVGGRPSRVGRRARARRTQLYRCSARQERLTGRQRPGAGMLRRCAAAPSRGRDGAAGHSTRRRGHRGGGPEPAQGRLGNDDRPHRRVTRSGRREPRAPGHTAPAGREARDQDPVSPRPPGSERPGPPCPFAPPEPSCRRPDPVGGPGATLHRSCPSTCPGNGRSAASPHRGGRRGAETPCCGGRRAAGTRRHRRRREDLGSLCRGPLSRGPLPPCTDCCAPPRDAGRSRFWSAAAGRCDVAEPSRLTLRPRSVRSPESAAEDPAFESPEPRREPWPSARPCPRAFAGGAVFA